MPLRQSYDIYFDGSMSHRLSQVRISQHNQNNSKENDISWECSTHGEDEKYIACTYKFS